GHLVVLLPSLLHCSWRMPPAGVSRRAAAHAGRPGKGSVACHVRREGLMDHGGPGPSHIERRGGPAGTLARVAAPWPLRSHRGVGANSLVYYAVEHVLALHLQAENLRGVVLSETTHVNAVAGIFCFGTLCLPRALGSYLVKSARAWRH